jgi:hypothetical protein
MKIQLLAFEGKTPRVYTKLTDESKAQTATNCDLRHGNLRPLKGMTEVTTPNGLLVVDLGGNITAFADYSGTQAGTVKATTDEAHGLSTGYEVIIFGTTNYNGSYAITVIDSTSFYFTATWVSNDATGEWVYNWVVVQDDTGNMKAVAAVDNGDGTVTFQANEATGLSVGDTVWFDGDTGAVGYYPSVYTVVDVDDGNPYTFDITADYVAVTPNANDDWYAGDIVSTGQANDIYLLYDAWLSFATETDVAESFLEDNNYRIYYTSPTGPRQTDYDLATSGAESTWPTSWTQFGVEQPIGPLNAVAAADDDFVSLVDVAQSTAYVYTYVTSLGEEGVPCTATQIVDIADDDKVTITGFASPVKTNNDVDYVRIYKLCAGDNISEYQIIKKRGGITAVADSGGDDKAVFTSTNHRLITGDTVIITGTTSYNGTYTVTSYKTVAGHEGDAGENNTSGTVTDDYFELTDADGNIVDYVSSQTGYWNQTNDISLTEALGNGFVDRTNPSDAGIVMFTDDFDAPPSDLEGLLLYTSNTYVGFSGNTVCFSEPNYPYAWPVEYQIPVAHNVVGIGHFMETVVVCTDSVPYMSSGTSPQSMVIQPLPYKRPCLAKSGIVSIPSGVIYPTNDGLFMISASGCQLITDGLITREQWNDYDLTNIQAEYYDDRYYAFFENSRNGFYIDIAEPLRIIDIQLPASCTFKNVFTDGNDLYVQCTNNAIYKWDDDEDSPLTYTWKSKKFQILTAMNMSAGRIIGSLNGDLTVNIYADDELKASYDITDETIFRLPAGYRAKVYEIELIGTDNVDVASIGSSVNQMIYGQ